MPMTLIQRQVLGGSQTSLTFSNIPQNYQTLAINLSSRNATNTSNETVGIRFNTDSNVNYPIRFLQGSGSTTASGGAAGNVSSIYIDILPGTGDTASTFSSASVIIPNYNGNLNKTVSADAVSENNGTTAYQRLYAGLWNNTSAITHITILSVSGFSLVSGSTFSLYGIS